MRERRMDRTEAERSPDQIGRQPSLIVDGVQWSPETAYLFRKKPPSVYPGFFDQQGRYLEGFPVLCQVRNRLNQVLTRVTEARETAERELRR